jgi:hypothetical protein
LVAAEPKESLDWKRIAFFENEIANGKRPFAIIHNAAYLTNGEDADWISENYIIDGHHKLYAYRNLNIHPSLAVIYKEYESKMDIPFDFPNFKEKLYPWQVDHLVKNWEEKAHYENGKRVTP